MTWAGAENTGRHTFGDTTTNTINLSIQSFQFLRNLYNLCKLTISAVFFTVICWFFDLHRSLHRCTGFAQLDNREGRRDDATRPQRRATQHRCRMTRRRSVAWFWKARAYATSLTMKRLPRPLSPLCCNTTRLLRPSMASVKLRPRLIHFRRNFPNFDLSAGFISPSSGT